MIFFKHNDTLVCIDKLLVIRSFISSMINKNKCGCF